MRVTRQHLTVKKTQRRIPRAVKIAGATILLAATAAAIIVTNSSSTLALWNDSAKLPEATITVGKSPGLSIATGTHAAPAGEIGISFPPATWADMLPGDVIGTPITIANLDARSYELVASVEMPQGGIADLRFALVEGGCVPGPFPAGSISATPAKIDTAALSGRSSRVFCLKIELSASVAKALQGEQIAPSFKITVHGDKN